MIMMALGLFVFALRTVPYQELQHQKTWRHAANSRVGALPATQYLGADLDTITLSGVLLPELTGGRLSFDELERIADLGMALPLIEATGTIYGMFFVDGLSKTKSAFHTHGVARKIEFTLTLKRASDDSDVSGAIGDQFKTIYGGM